VPYAPANDQQLLVSEIQSGQNRYAAEILAFLPSDPQVLARIYPETRRALKQLLEDSEPEMAKSIGEFGFTDVARYANWLNAVATLSAATGGPSYEDVVFGHLNSEKTDPRKVMAFLISPEGKRFIAKVGQKAPFETSVRRATVFSKQLPMNMLMRDTVREITEDVNALKG
jgi:hypothetical protein